MKQFITLILLFSSFYVCAQQTETIYLDRNKEEVRRKKKAHYIKIITKTDQYILTELKYVRSKKLISSSERNLETNEITKKTFDSAGRLKSATTYLNGDKHGNETTYYWNGNKTVQSVYKMNKKEGTENSYSINGELSTTVNYINDKKEGIKLMYYKSGATRDSLFYKNDELNGIWYSYFETGELKSKVLYKDDEKEGLYISYYENGNTQTTVNYKFGSKIGPKVTLFESGSKKDSSFYKEGDLSGNKTKWFETGELKYKAEYSENEINGTQVSYHKNGQLKRRDEFNEGRFIEGNCYTASGKDTTYYDYEIPAMFPGGENKLFEFLGRNIKYNSMAKEMGVKGTIYIRFLVEKDGSLSEFEVIRGIGAGLDESTIKALKKMPNWTPGYQDGIPVSSRFILPTKYTLR